MTILVVGESLIDAARRTSGDELRTPGGSPLNVAVGLARLDNPTALLTHIGNDPEGAHLLDYLQREKITLLGTPRDTTTLARATIADDGTATYEFQWRWEQTANPVVSAERAWKAIHVGSISAFLPPSATVVDQILTKAAACLRTFDPNIRPHLLTDRNVARDRFECLASQVHVVKLSDEDAAWLYPSTEPDPILRRILTLGPDLSAMTKGAAGATLMTRRFQLDIPAPASTVADTIGAGDSFMAGLIHGLANVPTPANRLNLDRASTLQIGHFAATLAGITVSRPGANPPTLQELQSSQQAK